MRTQVAIIGSGPSGLLLSQLLAKHGIESTIIDRVSEDYILSRVRAGVLESGTVDLLEKVGVTDRLHSEGLKHSGFYLAFDNHHKRVDLEKHTGKSVTVYGQTEITRDLMDARATAQIPAFYNAKDVECSDIAGSSPKVSFKHEGQSVEINCDFIAGCDGFHGVSRKSIPEQSITTYERIYPFGWLGLLADVPPVGDELIYANHPRGFALCSMRSKTRTRCYIQCDIDDRVENWSDDAIWDELRRRLPDEIAESVTTGPSFEKSIAPLRSFVAEPMRFGRLFLAGDAAHIVPPTGAKGLNLAASDVHYLSEAIGEYYADGSKNQAALDQYSTKALSRIWKAVRFSWWMTTMMHRFPENGAFGQRIQEAELDYLFSSDASQTSLAENYVGLPY